MARYLTPDAHERLKDGKPFLKALTDNYRAFTKVCLVLDPSKTREMKLPFLTKLYNNLYESKDDDVMKEILKAAFKEAEELYGKERVEQAITYVEVSEDMKWDFL